MEVADHLDVVSRHDQLLVRVLGTFRPVERARLVSRPDEHLRPVVLAETSVAATLLLAQHVHGHEELAVCLDLAGNGDDHATPDIIALYAAQEKARVVSGARLVTGFLEGLDVGYLGSNGGTALANKLDLGILLQNTALDTARDDGTTAGNGEDILDSHEEGLIGLADGCGDPGVDGVEQLVNLLLADFGLLALKGTQRGPHDDGGLVALEAVAAEQLAHLHLDELQHLLVVNSVDLVDEDDDLLDTDLAGEQQVLAGLGHLAVRGGDDDDGAVHVGGTGDHVLDVVGVAGTVDVGIVALIGRVLNVGSGNGDTALALFGSLVDGAVLEELGKALLGLALGDGGGESRLCGVSVGRQELGRGEGTFPWSTWPMVPGLS